MVNVLTIVVFIRESAVGYCRELHAWLPLVGRLTRTSCTLQIEIHVWCNSTIKLRSLSHHLYLCRQTYPQTYQPLEQLLD